MAIVKPAERQRKIPLIRGFDALERIEHVFRCSPEKALDILQGWIREERLRAYPVNAPFDYDDASRGEESENHTFKYELSAYLTENDLVPGKIEGIDWAKISVRENELNDLLAGKPLDEAFSGPAWETDKTKWTPLDLAVHQVAEASGLPRLVARSSLFHAVNTRRTYALCAIRPGLAPSVWFMGVPGKPRLVDPAPPETVVDPLSLEAWIAEEFAEKAPPEIASKRGRTPTRRPPGATPQWDWEAFEERFVDEVKKGGFPDKLNVKGWRTQADVVRWVQGLPDFTKSDPEKLPSPSSIKTYVRRWMDDHATGRAAVSQ